MGVAGEGIDKRNVASLKKASIVVKLSLYRTFGRVVEYLRGVRGQDGLNSGQECMDSM